MDKVEEKLTPKEWAIKFADEMRQAPNLATAIRQERFRDMNAVCWALAEDKHPGKKPEDQKVQRRLSLGYWAEWKVRFNLVKDIQGTIQRRAEIAGLEVALKLQTLLTMILQDSFSRTASKAAQWVEEYKTADATEEKNRQLMLDELDAYSVNLEADEGPRSLDMGFAKMIFPSKIQVWADAIKALVFDIFRHQAAVKVIQDKFFDGHLILAKDIEAGLDRAIGNLKDVIDRHNEYLEVRSHLFTAEWDEDEAEEGSEGERAGLSGEREGLLKIDVDQLAPTKASAEELANTWAKMAKADAAADVTQAEQGSRAAFDFIKTAMDDTVGEGPMS